MSYLLTDQYTRVDRNCPVSVDLHPVDDVVEIVLGEHRSSGGLRLQIDHPDTCDHLTEAIANARNQLVEHQRATAVLDPTTPQSDNDPTAPVAG
jgi:hypothetical protein